MTGSCWVLCLVCLVASVWAYQLNRREYLRYLTDRMENRKDSLTIRELHFYYQRFLRRRKISLLMFCLGPVAAGMGVAISRHLAAGTFLVYVALLLLMGIIGLAIRDGIVSYAYFHDTEARRALRQAKKEIQNALEKANAEKESKASE